MKAWQSLTAMSSPASMTELKVLPQPVWLGDVGRWNSNRADKQLLAVLTKIGLTSKYNALMAATLQEVVDL